MGRVAAAGSGMALRGQEHPGAEELEHHGEG